MAELHEQNPLYLALEAYAERIFQAIDCEVPSPEWPSELDLEELERHLLDSLSELALSLEQDLDQARQAILLSMSFNNFGVALNLLRSMLLAASWQGLLQTNLAGRLKTLWEEGIGLKQGLWQELNKHASNLKQERKWKL